MPAGRRRSGSCSPLRRPFLWVAGERVLPVLALEQAARLHRLRIVIVEAAGVDAVILGVGARVVEGVDAAMAAEGVAGGAGVEGVGGQRVGAAEDLHPLLQHR